MALLIESESQLLGSDVTYFPGLDRGAKLRQGGRLPCLSSESITWRTVGNEVEVSVALVNESEEPTRADNLIIEAAAFGAFIPTQPAARIAVGSMEPGEGRTVTARMPIADLPQAQTRPASFHMRRMLKRHCQDLNLNKAQGWINEDRAFHWIGNFNVYFDSDPETAFERHVAFGLKVPKNGLILGAFSVDAEQFLARASSSSEDWEVESAVTWREIRLFVTTPAMSGEKAKVRAEVTRLPDQATVFVEFEFETVDGWGESVGCISA